MISEILISTIPDDFWDEDLGGGWERVFAHAECIGLKEPGLIGPIKKSLQHKGVVVVVHGNRDFRLELFDHLLGTFGTHRVRSSNGNKENIYMPDEIKLIFIKRLSHIAGVADAEAVHFEDKGGSLSEFIPGSHMDGYIIDQNIA